MTYTNARHPSSTRSAIRPAGRSSKASPRGLRRWASWRGSLPVSRPAVSQHLKVLKEAGLVTDEAEGTRRIYRLDPRGIAAVREWLDAQWGQALTAFKDFADEAWVEEIRSKETRE